MKTLVIDIETSPNLAHTWGLWQQNVGLPQLLKSGTVLCFAAKWTDSDTVMFRRGPDIAKKAHVLFDKADVIVHYNGARFDVPWLQSEMVRAELTPPSPYTQIDLLKVVKANFRFPSNKLEYVASELLGERKAATGGHQLWIDCEAGKREAWRRMQQYNEQDVLLTERLYRRLRPWIKLPNPALYGTADIAERTCPECGSGNVHSRGVAYTTLSSYPRFQCRDCGRWGRGANRIKGVNIR